MLILAGVSINAIIGENGLLTKSQYATFLNEMAAVEEAVGMWKAGEAIEAGGQTTAIPTNGMCKSSDITSTERLTGEVGYYRVWSMSETRPTTNILSSAVDFNSAYSGELVTYPAGVQDLYYLNNEACGIDSKKTYLIDAATGMVYSIAGINLKGVSCYSSNMAKAVMNGDTTAPNFAEAEVSGTTTGEKLAGNVQSEFLEDGVTSNPNYNPNGFQIISHPYSNNIYKLYNNGDLYGKGEKGTQLNTSTTEMETINASKWTELTIPSEIGEYKKVIPGYNTMYVIDSNDELWAWGDNNGNKLGLTKKQRVEYTGREPIKLNVAGKKVKNVWNTESESFVLTIDNCLYGMGLNTGYQLGIGHNQEITEAFLKSQNQDISKGLFQQIDVPNPENIKAIMSAGESKYFRVIVYNDNKFYATGNNARNLIGNGSSGVYKKFLQIWNGYTYKLENDEYVIDESIGYQENIDIDEHILEIAAMDCMGMSILKDDKTLWFSGNYTYTTETTLKNTILSQFPETIGKDVKHIYGTGYGYFVWKENGEVWGADNISDCLGIGNKSRNAVKLPLPDKLVQSGIKEIYCIGTTTYYLSNDNDLFASSVVGTYLGMSRKPIGIEEINSNVKFNTLYPSNEKVDKLDSLLARNTRGAALFEGKDGKLYTIGNSTILYRNNVLQTNWTKMASNVEKLSLGYSNSIAYIEKNTKNVYVAGDDSRILDQNTEVQIKIPNFVLLDDELIKGKVRDVQFSRMQMYILDIDGNLYSTGLNNVGGGKNFAGWDELENHYTLFKILENVLVFHIDADMRMAIADGKLYTWGDNAYGSIQQSSQAPKELVVTGLSSVSDVKNICVSRANSMIIMNNGNVFCCGNGGNGNYIHFGKNSFSLLDNIWNFEKGDEKIIEYRTMIGSAAIVLTNYGNVYAWGLANYLGIGDESSTRITQPVKVLENVEQITSGSGFFVAIKKDGTVWGTGSNMYGVLGRWKGAPRESGRYRTAFEWVECPELEI